MTIRERATEWLWSHGYEEWSDIPRFAWYGLTDWWAKARCRVLGHRPAVERSYGIMQWSSVTVWGHPELSQGHTEEWNEIRRFCPRCGRLENRAKTKYKREEHPPQDNTLYWSDQQDPETWGA